MYIGMFCIFYGIFLKYEKQQWINTNSIVTKVKVKDTIINNINGIEISEINSNADVIYKINDEIHQTNINVVKNQPLQIGNVIPIQYNNNDIKRKNQNIPHFKYWITYGCILLLIASYLYKYVN